MNNSKFMVVKIKFKNLIQKILLISLDNIVFYTL